MSLPPRTFGERGHAVIVRRDGSRWAVTIDGRVLSGTFASEPEARSAGDAERLRLDGISAALLRRVRRSLRRKQ
jgi:hypothetical protein